MTVLGLDCAGKTAGVALCRDGELFYESRLCAGFTHSETLLPLCEEALRACRLSLQDISLLAVTAGPGSFTGLRIGLATVKGLAFAHGTPCAGVSTLEALAFCAPPVGSCVCALDARAGAKCTTPVFPWGRRGPHACGRTATAPPLPLPGRPFVCPGPCGCWGTAPRLCWTRWAAAVRRTYSFCPNMRAAPGRWGFAALRCRCSRKAPKRLPRAICAFPRQSASARRN